MHNNVRRKSGKFGKDTVCKTITRLGLCSITRQVKQLPTNYNSSTDREKKLSHQADNDDATIRMAARWTDERQKQVERQRDKERDQKSRHISRRNRETRITQASNGLSELILTITHSLSHTYTHTHTSLPLPCSNRCWQTERFPPSLPL